MAQESIRIDGINELLAMIKDIHGNVITKNLMDEIGTFVEDSILLRTAEGKDVEGNFFEPYSPKYKLFRMKHGHPADKVNLFWHGSMLSSMTHISFKEKVRIYFQKTYGKTPSGKPSKVSNPEKAFFLQQKRDFFGVSEEEFDAIMDMIYEHLDRLLSGE